MPNKISTDEVQYEKDLKEIKFYWEVLNKTYYSTISRLHFLKHENPYLMTQIMYGLTVAIDSILSAYKTDKEFYLCKHCKQLYIKDFPCLERSDLKKIPCEPMDELYHKGISFEDTFDYKKRDKKNERT